MTNSMNDKAGFFIAGMPRSGTTSLYTYLKQHPEIFLSLYKEPHFFSRDLTQSSYNIQDPGLYDSLFMASGDKKARGEGSVWYLTSQVAAQGIKEYNPHAKIIIMLRNPLDMIYSLHSLYLRTGNEDIDDFTTAVEAIPRRKRGELIPPGCYFPEGLLYTEVGLYYEKIERFLQVFGSEAIHFVIFDEFSAHTSICYGKILEFLGVDANFGAEFNARKASAMVRGKVIEQIRHAHPIVKKMLSRKTGKDSHMGPKPTPMPAKLKLELQAYFAEDLDKTGQLIGKNLSHWSK